MEIIQDDVWKRPYVHLFVRALLFEQGKQEDSDRQTDATKPIISPALRSIKIPQRASSGP